MNLEEKLEKIKEFLLERYRNNLAAILIFGSANTKHFIEGKSDIDTIILLKSLENLTPKDEIIFLVKKLKRESFATSYFHSLNSIKEHIRRNNRFGWSTYITLIAEDGSRVLYSTPEFEILREELLQNPPRKKEIKDYLNEKDKFELEGYFKESKGFILTKGLMSHLRRKLQIINYLETGNFVFDYEKCLNKIKLSKNEKENLQNLYEKYEKRKSLSKKEIEYYYLLAKRLTNFISS